MSRDSRLTGRKEGMTALKAKYSKLGVRLSTELSKLYSVPMMDTVGTLE